MTIEDLYNWAVKNCCADYQIIIPSAKYKGEYHGVNNGDLHEDDEDETVWIYGESKV